VEFKQLTFVGVSILACVTTACVLFSDGLAAPLAQSPAPVISSKCDKISEKPALYQCKMPEWSTYCYVALTGISCVVHDHATTASLPTPTPTQPIPTPIPTLTPLEPQPAYPLELMTLPPGAV